MRKLLILLAIPFTTTAYAQMDIGVFGMHASVPQTSFASGWGGGINIFFRPFNHSSTFPLKFQLGVTAYASGAGHYELTRVGTGAPQNVWAQTVFTNMHMGFYGDARFTFRNEQSRYMPYIDLFGGIRNLHATQNTVQYSDTSGITLSGYTGLSGGAGLGMMMKISKSLWLDAGLQWQTSMQGGKFVNTRSVSYAGDGITYSMQNAPVGMILFKLGLSFRTASNDHSDDFSGRRRTPTPLNEL